MSKGLLLNTPQISALHTYKLCSLVRRHRLYSLSVAQKSNSDPDRHIVEICSSHKRARTHTVTLLRTSDKPIAASQEVLSILCNTNVHYLAHNSASLVPAFFQTNLVRSIPCYSLISIYQVVFYFIHTEVYYYYFHSISGKQSIAFKTILIPGV